MLSPKSFAYRLGTVLSLMGISSIAIPVTAISAETSRHLANLHKADQERRAKLALVKPSRPLLASELKALAGKTSYNPYLSGSAKWGINVDGVDLMTGNLSMSATDLSFEGGYGIPVNVTRTYSSNNGEEGPLGLGWTLSVDLRSTAGGLLKSSGAPVRSVPVQMKERPSDQTAVAAGLNDGINEPISAMLATDAAGTEQTIQRDADGIVMPPAWDHNIIETEYEAVTIGDDVYQIAKSQTITTPEGTVYEYAKMGEYVRNTGTTQNPVYVRGGLADYRDSAAVNNDGEPSNILKVTSVTDRHGNETTYSYSTDNVYFQKVNGLVQEKKLTSIAMPGGRGLWFTWGTGNLSNRVISVKDALSGTPREVEYSYNSERNLSVAESAAGKDTTYGYSLPWIPTNEQMARHPVLSSVTDSRGLTTQYYSCVANVLIPQGRVGLGTYTYRIVGPNGLDKRFEFVDDPTEIVLLANSRRVYVLEPTSSGGHWQNVNYRMLTNYEWYASSLPSGIPSDIDEGPFLCVRATRTTAGGLNQNPGPLTEKYYSSVTQNLVHDVSVSVQQVIDQGQSLLHYYCATTKTTWHNFRGQPLREIVADGIPVTIDPGVPTGPDRVMVTDYAYWGRDKYFQQKAVRGPFQWGVTSAGNIRYSFTDYYDNQADQGWKGQTKRVYRTGVDSGVSNGFTYIPSGVTPVNITGLSASVGVGDTAWKRTIMPASNAIHAAEFTYDSKGRAVTVQKLQKVVSGTPTYVETRTTYGVDGGSTWGMPIEVVEDYGTGKINRTTTTEEYDLSGRAKVVIDGNGRKMRTNYDADGVVLSIDRYSNTYGWGQVSMNSYLSSGQLDYTQDWGQDALVQMYYGATNSSHVGERGHVTAVDTVTANDNYTIVYEYDQYGRRKSMRSYGGHKERKFEYRGYKWVGMPGQEQPVFTEIVEMEKDGTEWIASKESFQYSFDETGRLNEVKFALTPTRTTREVNLNSWYTETEGPSHYASAQYHYDPSGRLLKLKNVWNTPTGSEIIRSSEYAYTGDFRLRSQFALKNKTSTLYAENYAYDSKLDYLTSATYSDQSGANGSWTYDAAGNRANSGYAYDNLNRMTNAPGSTTYSHDVVGNRLSSSTNGTGYVWDHFNRLIELENDFATTQYNYLPNGLRSTKIQVKVGEYVMPGDVSGFYDENFWQNYPTTRYRYDGQMTLEEDVTYTTGENIKVDETRYTLGVRGIESMVAERVSGDSEPPVTMGVEYRSFPLYDGHGNMIATLTRNGTGYTLGAEKRYEVWGSIRAHAQGGAILNPNKGYVANLGHTRDEESGLTYMRARYYEPWTGRFISEDPAMDGGNWFSYASNNPANLVDPGGEADEAAFRAWYLAGLLTAVAGYYYSKKPGSTILRCAGILSLSAGFFAVALGMRLDEAANARRNFSAGFMGILMMLAGMAKDTAGADPSKLGRANAMANIALISAFTYSLMILGALMLTEGELP